MKKATLALALILTLGSTTFLSADWYYAYSGTGEGYFIHDETEYDCEFDWSGVHTIYSNPPQLNGLFTGTWTYTGPAVTGMAPSGWIYVPTYKNYGTGYWGVGAMPDPGDVAEEAIGTFGGYWTSTDAAGTWTIYDGAYNGFFDGGEGTWEGDPL